MDRLTCVVISPDGGPEVPGAARTSLESRGQKIRSERELRPGTTEFVLEANGGTWAALADWRDAFRQDYAVDVVICPQANRQKKLLIADMDSTIIQQECIDELADFVGKKSEVAAITERAMRGELDFEQALRSRVAMLAGLTTDTLERCFRERIVLTPGARQLVSRMKATGANCHLVSGGFTFFTERVAKAAGFDSHQANRLEIANGRLTGRVTAPILGREAKLAALERLVAEKGLSFADTLAVGDGANDLSMLNAAGCGVAFHAKPIVAREADAAIFHADLRALLDIQGIEVD